MNRRHFCNDILKAAAIPLLLPAPAHFLSHLTTDEIPGFRQLKTLIASRVNIDKLEIVKFDDRYLLRVIAADGTFGCTICNQHMELFLSFMAGRIFPYFKGKDARDIEFLVDDVYTFASNYKYAGVPFWNAIGHVEIAIFDLLGKLAGIPVKDFFGKSHHDEIPLYISSTSRDTTPEQETARFVKALEETGAAGIKFKIGGRMSKNMDASPKRTENLLPLLRNTLGSKITFYADANGSYDVKEGIRIAKFLKDFDVKIFEEPVPFDEYENTLAVKKAVKGIEFAGGEQDTSSYRFEWMAKNGACDVFQPDLYYNGGMIRCYRVAKMAEKYGLKFSPHSPKTDPLAAPMLHLMSVIQNTGGLQEWYIDPGKIKNWYQPNFKVVKGSISVPSGPGLGIYYDEAIWKKGERMAE